MALQLPSGRESIRMVAPTSWTILYTCAIQNEVVQLLGIFIAPSVVVLTKSLLAV